MKILFWEKILLFSIILALSLSLYFIWPPTELEDQEQYFGYLDEEFNGLPELVYFKPRINARNQNVEKIIPKSDVEMEADLQIDKLAVNAPIIFNVNAASSAAYLEALEKGVAHFAGTALPDQDKGNIFIFGHSSYYSRSPGDYKEIFAQLENISLGDKIIIQRKDQEEQYKYAVAEIKIVKADYTEAFNQTGDKRLTLMTCWPVGTSRQRLLVIAKPVE